ncbi:hypothetical protein ABZ912_03720 [Nonomuraea angiospora]|uniref:hypothetical protein n=1 Tax=Nonomuraea angiospora TaxID=46172 RepID=UPI0034034177
MALVLIAVAGCTAAAGPVAFVALAAPQIAQRLARTAWPPGSPGRSSCWPPTSSRGC